MIYDAGVLIAADRNVRRVWADHRARLELGIVPSTTAPVAAQVIRSSQQVSLRRFLRGCEIAGFLADDIHEVGSLLRRTGGSDVVDAHLVVLAAQRRSTVLTSDPDDLGVLSAALPDPVRVQRL